MWYVSNHISFFLILKIFISLSCLIALAIIISIMLNNCDYSYLCYLPDVNEKLLIITFKYNTWCLLLRERWSFDFSSFNLLKLCIIWSEFCFVLFCFFMLNQTYCNDVWHFRTCKLHPPSSLTHIWDNS